MGFHTLAMMYSHLQNATRARLGLTSVPVTKKNLQVLVALHKLGFITHVVRGGPIPPDPAKLSMHTPEPLTSDIVSSQRLWIGLKYHNNKPVMKFVTAISTPTRKITADLRTIEKISKGFDTPFQRGLNLGEALIVATDRGVMDAREAAERKVGGTLLCRVGP